jgi:hypothetical protein
MRNKNWKLRTGVIILIISFSTTPMILATPFLGLPGKTKVLIVTILVVIGNITFYSGGYLVGKELFDRYKSRINPRNWIKNPAMFSTILDLLRIALVGVAFFFGYQAGFANGYDPVAQIHVMTPIIVTAIAGISGLEGLLFGQAAAASKGFVSDGNYQRQSAIALLSYAIVALLVYFLDWGIRAELAILFAFVFFFTFSSVNHAVNAIRNHNYKWQNINRPFLTILLIGGLAYPVIKALEQLLN